MRKVFQASALTLITALLLFGCATEPAKDSKLTSISITPAAPSIASGAAKQFIATGSYSDNTSKDLTGSVAWASSDPDVAAINTSGLATAVTAGATEITASKDGVTGNTTLTVTSGAQPSKATLMLSVTGSLPAGTLIGGIDIAVSLPAGASLKSTTNAPETDAGVAVASGVAAQNSTVLATYSAPTGTVQGRGRLLIGNTHGFGTGEFATVSADIAAGSSPQATDFSVTGFTATDLNGIEISGLTPGFTVEMQ